MRIHNSLTKEFNEAFLQSLLSKLFLCWCILAGTAACLAHETTENDAEDRIIRTEIANLNVPLLFEATREPVSLSTKRTIAEDLSRILWPMDTLRFKKRHQKTKPVKVQERPDKLKFTHRVVTDETKVCSTTVVSPFLPELFRKHFGGSVKLEGTQHLLIRKEVISKYKEKIKFRKNHAEMFQKIPAFIQLLESPRDVRKLLHDSVKLKSIIYRFCTKNMIVSWEEASSYIEATYAQENYMNVRYPSLLQIGPLNEIDPTTNKKYIVMKPWIKYKEIEAAGNEYIRQSVVGAYRSKRWKMLVIPLP